MKCINASVEFVFIFLLFDYSLCQPLNNTTGDECNDNSDCVSGKICVDLKCVDPCLGVCGLNTLCVVQNLLPVCSCKPGYEGDPFTDCQPGDGVECTRNGQCSMEKACINLQCQDPCRDACGVNSDCKVVKHRPMCACLKGFVFSPQAGCKPVWVPECQSNSNCPEDSACLQQKCVDPCEEAMCGNNTLCTVKKHFPICSCKLGFVGNALDECVAQCSTETGESSTRPKKKTFSISDVKTSWMEGVRGCRSQGMYLATLNNEDEENELKRSWISKYGNVEPSIWLGAYALTNNLQFSWVSTGEEFTYTNWRYREPNGSDMHCLGYGHDFTWFAFTCRNNLFFACESK